MFQKECKGLEALAIMAHLRDVDLKFRREIWAGDRLGRYQYRSKN